jgi:hypothetical protein
MEAEQTQLFNQKLSQWIASQGFWFQLRHSMSGGGGWSMTMSHLMRLGFKLLVVLLVAAGGFGIYLLQRVKTDSFKDYLNAGLAGGLGATEAQVLDFERSQGIVQIRLIGAEGGEGTFFRSLDAGNVRLKMGLLAGIAGSWDAGTLQAKWLEIDLKAGADSAEQAKKQSAAFFRDWENFRFSSIEVYQATVRWGFSPRTQGWIERSNLVATRGKDSWRLEFTGGTLTQNWLRKLEIVELVVNCTPGGLEVVKGEFKVGGGSVFLRDVTISGGDQPQVGGAVEISQADLASFLPDPAKPLVEGVISGTFALSGSTNSAEGLQMEGDVTLGGGNLIAIREKLPLLNALSLKDLFNSYHRVPFDRGSFHLKTGGGAMELTRVDLKAGELMTAQGRILMRFPRDNELAAGTGAESDFAPLIRPGQDPSKDGADGRAVELSLEKAARADKAEKEARGGSSDMALFERGNQRRINDVLLQQEIARRAQALRAEPGSGLRITIPGDAFDRWESLREAYPVDPSSGRIPINVPLQGALHELTFQQAKEMLELGQR